MSGKYNINAWNDLPKDVTEAEKLNIFKNRLGHYFMSDEQ